MDLKEKPESNKRRDFIKKSLITSVGLTSFSNLIFGKNDIIDKERARPQSGNEDLLNVAFICQAYFTLSHADVIGTKFIAGIPTDDGMMKPKVKIVSMYIEQTGPGDIGTRIAEMNEIRLYPAIADALTLGGDKLAVDGVIYVGEHGDFPYNRLHQKMYPRLNYLEQIFRVFDASGRSVPLFTDKALSYSWLDSMWIYNRGKELNVPMMAGSSAPYWWRDPNLGKAQVSLATTVESPSLPRTSGRKPFSSRAATIPSVVRKMKQNAPLSRLSAAAMGSG